MFHGSYHPFEPGDIVQPPSEGMPAYATNSKKEARQYGEIYQVEPLSIDDQYPTSGNKSVNYESNTGFRIIKHIKSRTRVVD